MMRWLVVGALSMAIGIALGAFGAHALRDTLSSKELEWWLTAQEYQVWHALGLVLIGSLEKDGRRLTAVGWLFVFGTVVFGGTLYAMALGAPNWFGAITPVGGASFITGWIVLAYCIKNRKDEPKSVD